jgi:hypothetical protein
MSTMRCTISQPSRKRHFHHCGDHNLTQQRFNLLPTLLQCLGSPQMNSINMVNDSHSTTTTNNNATVECE